MNFQLRHHGKEIPADNQPKCGTCGGHMSIHNDAAGGGWWWTCLDYDCESPFKQHEDWPFEELYGDWCFIPAHELMRKRAKEKGLPRDFGIDEDGQVWRCVDSPSWGGNHSASRHDQPDGSRSKLFWTGHKGQVAEEWIKLSKENNHENH